ncbi:MAG TPA: 3-deoxy-D-manno-octulosonic acid transferase [Gemmataceae bacterium]|nr:3-deoxy-D-manno-octulosonic acid transferase [Gemmataceae bacterium]
MPNAYDITWGLLLGIGAPAWLLAPKLRGKVLKAFRERMGPQGVKRDMSRPAVMIHAVSLGEINATRAMVEQLGRGRPDLQFVITTTTDTGFARGRELYGNDPNVALVRYPLDFTRAIERLFTSLRPDVVVLMELEVWPNFVYRCERRGVPVFLVNGRLTPSSFASYRRGGPVVRRMFRRLAVVCAQDPAYADRFIALGAPADRVRVTGTMKFDTAQVADRIPGDDALAAAVGLRPGEPVWVCGSTGPGEEGIVLRAYRSLLERHPRLRLVIVPRHPERFDEVASLIQSQGFDLIRRSKSPEGAPSAIRNPQSAIPPVILGDTMGELRKFYSLATIAFVGRTLVDLGPRQHGSDMIEPAALAKPVIVGPWTHNFAEPMNRFREADAMRVVASERELTDAASALLADPANAAEMGRRAQDVVRREQGATARHVELILRYLPPASNHT